MINSIEPKEISVTQEDIDKGVRISCAYCPISLATRRTFPGATQVMTLTNSISFVLIGEYHNYELPIEAQEFTCDFDEDGPVAPFQFTIPFQVKAV